MSMSVLVGTALLAVLLDRHLLDRIFGSSSPLAGGRVVFHCAKVCGMLCLLVPAACFSWIITDFVLLPSGLKYLCAPVFLSFVVGFGIAADALLARLDRFPLWNRLAQRLMVLSAVMGLMIVEPLCAGSGGRDLSLADIALAAGLACLAFGAILMLCFGIREKTLPNRTATVTASLARDIALAALLALALSPLYGVHFPGW
jgi:hypothetical protein